MSDSFDNSKADALARDIERFVTDQKRRHTHNFYLHGGLVFLSLLLGAAVTVASFLGWKTIAGVLGISITFLIGLQAAFSLGDKAEFQRAIFTEGENLLTILRLRVRGDIDFESVLESFMILRKYEASNLPKGRGTDMIKELYQKMPPPLATNGKVI
jgi:hypothetical protein